jgi:hypothetical protein
MAPSEQLLVRTTVPVAAPAVAGSNCTSSVEVWPEFSVIGNVAAGSVKPVPLTLAALTVTAPVPEDVIVTDCVAGVFSWTLPKDMLDALSVRVVVGAFRVSANVFETPLAVAVSVAV